jgi:hypothetical protein
MTRVESDNFDLSIVLLSLYDLCSFVIESIVCDCLTNVHYGLRAHLSSLEIVSHVDKMQ